MLEAFTHLLHTQAKDCKRDIKTPIASFTYLIDNIRLNPRIS